MQNFTFKKLSIADFEKIKPETGIVYELIDGQVVMSRPTIHHQRLLTKLSSELHQHFKNTSCDTYSEIEIKLNEDILVPDISIICDNTKFTNQRYNGAPSLVIEILSPSNQYNDTFVKLNKYEIFGVSEYWIVDPIREIITLYNYKNKQTLTFSNNEVIKSIIFPELEINLNEIF
ncbi:MAG: Uma2 family endonuclease [Tissierellia bacterium]|jgi:Uma2 family endonuclease|nr:Uma2 family endonuclease [Tissierellia bacterium]MDD4439094.1 Uma2 family endonuclease [Tissierellia bacterium]HCS11662.1 Uma2 family endonuclease [Clostridiales bacterium]